MRRWLVLTAVAIAAAGIASLLTLSGIIASDRWRDFVGWFSLFITVLGLGYTIYQVTLAESAARAAERAANEARIESLRRLVHHAATNAHALITEARLFLEEQQWGKAVLRLNDLGIHLAQIGEEDDEWLDLIQALREAADRCAALESGRLSQGTYAKWEKLLREVRSRLDTYFTISRMTTPQGTNDDSPPDATRPDETSHE